VRASISPVAAVTDILGALSGLVILRLEAGEASDRAIGGECEDESRAAMVSMFSYQATASS
jgi:hypothetical protein